MREMRVRHSRARIAVLTLTLSVAVSGCSLENMESEHKDALGTEEISSPEYDESLSSMWAEFYGVSDPPEVEFVRFVASEEFDAVQRRCVIERGFAAPDGVNFEIPEGNEENFGLANYVCAMQYRVPKRLLGEWGRGQVEAQYRWTVEFVIPCLEEQGFPILPPPTEAAFIDLWDTPKAYFPFAEVELDIEGLEFNVVWEALEQTCPQQVPLTIAWGEQTIDGWIEASH